LKQVLDTILDIYSAPGSKSGWDHAVKSINTLGGGRASAYFMVNNDDHSNIISSNYGLPEYIANYYQEKGAKMDVRFKYMHNLIPGKVFRESEFVPSKDEWDSSEWIQYHYREDGVYYCMAARISTHGLWSDFIAVNRLKKLGQHTDQEKGNLQLLLPHLSRAGELHRLVTNLENKYGAVLSVLDKLLVGLVITDTAGRIVVANKTAESISGQSDSFTLLGNGYLKIFNENLDAELKELLRQTSATSSEGGNHDGGQLVLHSPAQGKKVLLEIMPIRDDGIMDSDNIQGSAIFILDPDHSQEYSTLGLADIFQLTQSESDIACSLVNGTPMNDISDQRNTSIETVRCQLKNIFAKTGTNSQIDLMRLAVKMNPPFEK